MRALEHADKELAQGRLWRAKEILQSTIPNAGYDPELFERLGLVLLKMGDLREAGRYLFLSGRRESEYEESIGLFLARYQTNPRTLYATFPRVAKLAARTDYPEPLTGELKQLGFPDLLREKGQTTLMSSDSSPLLGALGWGLAGAVLVTLILGVVKLIEIWRWIKTR